MSDQNFLAEQFEAKRVHLRRVAYRMLGSASEADDAVQEAWIRLSRADGEHVDNLGGWLTTVTARVCLDMLRARKARREEVMDAAADVAEAANAEHDRALADSVGAALLVVLETLAPAERVAFVLHDMFDVPFEEIASIVHRTPTAARQLASRARRRVQGGSAVSAGDRDRKQRVVNAFLTASHTGDLAGLLAVLDPNVALHADTDAVTMAASAGGAFPIAPEILGRDAVADMFKGRAAAARLAIVDDDIAAIYAPGGKAAAVFDFTIENGRITAIDIIANPERLGAMEIGPLG
ncbi:MAG: sigma-70 family RNA polymerase sigma factor [Proteobacteria bacterium]|nr:sigma-70 family RNA polymerase sigma factor [Pseudomonadota bacterium]